MWGRFAGYLFVYYFFFWLHVVWRGISDGASLVQRNPDGKVRAAAQRFQPLLSPTSGHTEARIRERQQGVRAKETA